MHRGRLPGQLAARLAGTIPCFTFVTYGELVKWMDVRSWSEHNRQRLTRWMDQCTIIGYSKAIAITWGRLAAAGKRRGRPVAPNDTWTAACCIVANLPLATCNIKDYADFAKYHGLKLFSA
jgi:predicted nucleic acid-binding protein